MTWSGLYIFPWIKPWNSWSNTVIFSASGARVSGVVEEKPGTLEYEVALYKEAPPKNKTLNQPAQSQGGELPVEQAVQIGTKLQLRARINPQSGKDPVTQCKERTVSLTNIILSPLGSVEVRQADGSNCLSRSRQSSRAGTCFSRQGWVSVN